ncbi:MAG: hypothetical protein KIT73_13850 [Burkholderiales bacterium]|nr:hypothetical protein [Burkholderiales bacterium]
MLLGVHGRFACDAGGGILGGVARPPQAAEGAIVMPTRMVREGLLDSERYWSVTIEARQLFFHLMLLADDLGCVSLAPVFLRRRCFDDRPSNEKVDMLLQQLQDADLLRIYEHEEARYGFIPRFRQRIQLRKLKHPAPPVALLQGDPDAQEKLFSFSNMTAKTSDSQPRTPVAQPLEAEAEAEAEVKKRHVVLSDADHPRSVSPDCPHERIIGLYHERLPTLPRVRQWTDARRKLLTARWREHIAAGEYATLDAGLTWWSKFFDYVAESSFLTGRATPSPGRHPFQADLEWLVRPSNLVRVIEGRYEDRHMSDAA